MPQAEFVWREVADMRRLLIALAAVLALASPTRAADSTVAAMTAASALSGSELFYCVQSGADRKCTPVQLSAYIFGLGSGDCTITSLGAIVCTKTNGTSFGALATVTPGTGVATALGNAIKAGSVLNQSTVLAASAVESAVHTGDTNLTTLVTIAVPGNTLGANGRLRITVLYRFTGTAGTKTPTISFGGTTFFTAPSGTTGLSWRLQVEVSNRNATNSQVSQTVAGGGGFASSAADVATATIDTTASQNILLQGQLANGGDSIAVESYLVELLIP
jgi:hypothetical protein